MPRKEKPPRQRRPKAAFDCPIYTTTELCARHRVSRRTLRRWGVERGFPEHWTSGREEVYAKAKVHEWERLNTPGLHAEPELSEEDKRWQLLYRRRQLEKEEEALSPPPPKPKRAARARV